MEQNLNSPSCEDCQTPYPFGLDLILPDQQWNFIMPDRDGGGLLCPTCICKRGQKLKGASVLLGWIDGFDWAQERPAEWFAKTE